MYDGFTIFVVGLVVVAIMFLVPFLVMGVYNGLDINQLVNGPDMDYWQAFGVTLILGVASRG
jgi:ABC-type Fe3+ transport system permease subunit